MQMKFAAVLLLGLLAVLPGGVTAMASAQADPEPVPKQPQKTKKRHAKAPVKRNTRTSSRTNSKTTAKTTAKPTFPESSPIRLAGPGTLQAMSMGVLERNSPSEERSLELFAQEHRTEVDGSLAHIVLGYHAYQDKHYLEAKKQFEAAVVVASPVQDYAQYYLALTEMADGDPGSAAENLDHFAAKYPSSPFASQAVLRQAESLLNLNRPDAVIALLVPPKAPQPEVATNLLLGEAYQKDQHPEKAAPFFQNIYYFYPTSWQALPAEKHLRDMKMELGGAYPEPSEEMRTARAEGLFAAGQWKDAESEYRTLASLASGAIRDHARVRFGVCLYRAGDNAGAIKTLKETEVPDADASAERLYTLAALYRRQQQLSAMDEEMQLLGQTFPDSLWYEKALFAAGTYYWPTTDPIRASQYYTLVYEKFPEGEDAAESQWKVAWQRYRDRRLPEAKQLFEEHIRKYPTSPHVSAAIYWMGRTLEAESPADAAPFYKKLVKTFSNYYYGQVARQRLAELPKLPAADENKEKLAAELLDPVRRTVPDVVLNATLSPSEQQHRKRAKLLESAWLIDFAIIELRGGIVKDALNSPLGLELAQLEVARGRYNWALSYAKRLFNGYFSYDIAELPREEWELLFPLPWWGQIKEKADALQLDPYLVAGLIRQESEFNPDARSRSDARGLMQLLPSTAKGMAKQVSGHKSHFDVASLSVPSINVAYGTTYLRKVLNLFNGSLEEAVAAYNAGENRVSQWLQQSSFEEPAEFVESIPFTETREYVQAVLRNALYSKLYPDRK